MELLEEYKELPKILKSQLRYISPHYKSDKDIINMHKDILNDNKDNSHLNEKTTRRLFHMCVLKKLTPRALLIPKFFDVIEAYNGRHTIRFTKCLKTGKHAKVMEGVLKNERVIVKWYKSKKRDIRYETSIYEKLVNMECPLLPWVITSYFCWNKPVLVIEKLQDLSTSENEYKLGVQIICQLKYLHTFGVHCDLKPQNIMKRVNSNGTNYTMIDFGGVTTEKMEDGYRRWLWSPKWTSQESHVEKQLTSARHDFIELGYTMKALQNWRKTNNRNDGNVKKGYRGKLSEYMERVKKIGRVAKNDDYDDLVTILSK